MSTETWFACVTAPQREFLVEKILNGLKIETLLPTERLDETRRRRSWFRRRGDEAARPLMPGFIFAAMPRADLPKLYGFSPILGVLGSGERPAALTAEDVSRIRAIEEAGAPKASILDAFPVFARGAIVKVTAGPAQGLRYSVVGQVSAIVTGSEIRTGVEMKIPACILEAVS